MAIKLEVFNLRGDVLSRITQGMNLYTSAKFRAFDTNQCCTIFLYYSVTSGNISYSVYGLVSMATHIYLHLQHQVRSSDMIYTDIGY